MYKYFLKRLADIVLAFVGVIVLVPFWLILAVAIKIDDPGPIFFKQKRIARNKNGEKSFFNILKYRSMKTSTPQDVPTHLLENPDQYITKVGKFLRKTSLDELPQIFCILVGSMSIIGPRPALWNQDDLYEEREAFGANDIRPGLTGWAQINGRDELEIKEKARLDGEYVKALNEGKFKGVAMDMKCFVGTIAAVFRSKGVVEGGTGELERRKKESDTW